MRIQVNAVYDSMKEKMVSIPGRFETEGTLLYQGRNTIKRFDDDGMSFVVKRFRKPMLIQRVIYTFFRPSKARRAYLNGLKLQQLGFSTPESIAYLETRSSGLLNQSYYICMVDDAPPICERLNDPEEFDRVMAADLARLLAALHQKGVLHGDFNSTNVLYRKQADGHYAFSLIDNNRMRFFEGTPPLPDCMENMTRFTGRMDLFEFVAREYVSARGLPDSTVSQLMAQKHHHDESWDRRKRILGKLKHPFKRS